MKTMFRHRPSQAAAFTLIELLVVIAIIAILAGLLFPALRTALERAKYAQARTEVMSIASAVKAYNNEYGKLPVPTAMQGQSDDAATALYAENVCVSVIRVLIDTLNTTGLNPRRIAFLETKATDGTFLDPWGTQYRMKLDTDYNNRISYKSTNYMNVAVVVSFGSDKLEGGTGKDVTSVE